MGDRAIGQEDDLLGRGKQIPPIRVVNLRTEGTDGVKPGLLQPFLARIRGTSPGLLDPSVLGYCFDGEVTVLVLDLLEEGRSGTSGPSSPGPSRRTAKACAAT